LTRPLAFFGGFLGSKKVLEDIAQNAYTLYTER